MYVYLRGLGSCQILMTVHVGLHTALLRNVTLFYSHLVVLK
jgi:hypothetical protein